MGQSCCESRTLLLDSRELIVIPLRTKQPRKVCAFDWFRHVIYTRQASHLTHTTALESLACMPIWLLLPSTGFSILDLPLLPRYDGHWPSAPTLTLPSAFSRDHQLSVLHMTGQSDL